MMLFFLLLVLYGQAAELPEPSYEESARERVMRGAVVDGAKLKVAPLITEHNNVEEGLEEEEYFADILKGIASVAISSRVTEKEPEVGYSFLSLSMIQMKLILEELEDKLVRGVLFSFRRLLNDEMLNVKKHLDLLKVDLSTRFYIFQYDASSWPMTLNETLVMRRVEDGQDWLEFSLDKNVQQKCGGDFCAILKKLNGDASYAAKAIIVVLYSRFGSCHKCVASSPWYKNRQKDRYGYAYSIEKVLESVQ